MTLDASGLSVLAAVSAESPLLMYSKTENLDCAAGFGALVVGFGGGGLAAVLGVLTAPPAVMPADCAGTVDLG